MRAGPDRFELSLGGSSVTSKISKGNPVGRGGTLLRRGVAIALIGTLALAAIPSPAAAASTYSWEFACLHTGNYYSGYDANATWDWLKDGAVIDGASGSAASYLNGCDPNGTSGSAERPAGANGVRVTLSAWVLTDSTTKTVTKKFAVDKPFSLSLSVTAADSAWECRHTQYCSSMNATLSIVA
jgi:hypothetical protein